MVLAANMLIDAVEVSVMIVAAPSIERDLQLGPVGAQWLISGFALGMGALLPFNGWIVQRFGRRRSYLAALLVFAAASAAAGVVDNLYFLVLTRVVKGLSAAFTAPAGLAIISTAFPVGAERDRAVSVYTLAGAGGFTTGLMVSGLLSEASWRWAVVFPAPLVLALFVAGMRLLPTDAASGKRYARTSIDLIGPVRRAAAGGGLPRSALGAAALNGSYLGLLFIVTRQLQEGLGWGPARTGLALLPASIPLVVTALHSGRMVRRVGAARLIAVGALAPPVGYAVYALREPPASYPADVLPTLLFVAAGFVLCFTALNTQAVERAADADRAVVGGVYQASVQAGAVAVLVLVSVALAVEDDSARAATVLITAVGLFGSIVGAVGVIPHRRRSNGE